MLPNQNLSPITDATDSVAEQLPGPEQQVGPQPEFLPSVELPLLNDPMGYGFQCWGGITLSGLIYSLAINVLFSTWALLALVFSGATQFLSALEVLFAFVGFSVAGFFIALLAAGIGGAVCVVLLWAVNLSLGKSIPRRICAISAAGLTGFMTLSAAIVVNADEMKPDAIALAFLAGPMLATLVMTLFVGYYIDRCGIFYEGVGIQSGTRLRIKIRHLLAITGWGAFVFAFANLLGMIHLSMLAMGWVILQTFVVGIEHYLKKWREWRFERRTKDRELEPLAPSPIYVTIEHSKSEPMF